MKRIDYLFQLVLITFSTCRKEAQNKIKQFPQGGKPFLPEQSLS